MHAIRQACELLEKPKLEGCILDTHEDLHRRDRAAVLSCGGLDP